MRLLVIGVGRVGLVTAAALASVGHDVTGSDADRIQLLRAGKLPFFEAGLDDVLHASADAGRLRFTADVGDALAGAEVAFLCVGRPPTQTGDQSLVSVEHASRDIARHADPGLVIAEKSTVPRGTAERIRRTVQMERPDLDFEIVANPEFLREGRALEDTLRPDRIVVGASTDRGFEVMRRLYRPLGDGSPPPIIATDLRTAELSKLACNAFLATKISFANALARLADLAGADVEGITAIMGSDPRIGPAFLGAGLGFGGFCLPKDLDTLERLSSRLGFDFALLREVRRINEEAVAAAVTKIEEAVWNLEGKRVALLGLAFKPGTDDVRSAPALALARRLLADRAAVVAHDPVAGEAAQAELPELELAPDPYEAAAGAHCLVLATEWPELVALDWARVRGAMAHPVVLDGRNALDQDALIALGFTYLGLGRGA